MSILFFFLIFLISCIAIYFAGEWLVDGVMSVARYLGWREFVLSFLVMAFIGSLPSLFVGISSALRGIPELSLGEITSSNLLDITLVLALPIILSKRAILVEGKTVNVTLLFTIGAALFPVLLLLDGTLDRPDGIILILFYFSYLFWLFSKRERFTKHYDEKTLEKEGVTLGFYHFIQGMGKTLLGVVLLLIAAQGMVWSAQGIAENFAIPVMLVGIFIVGIGNSLPELYFTMKSAKKRNDYMILGNLMGSIITPATLILGIVALINPIHIDGIGSFSVARIFLIIGCLLFFIFSRTGKKIVRYEAWILVALYVIFIITEIFINI